ncbi:MAG TPA: glycosyltransferase [Bryobacteraceae bacterium]|jgi:glycosyltransferase involved in cell wall biosynthesis|nr:glycosyltransferase [Bryobacteraceae bacterium]
MSLKALEVYGPFRGPSGYDHHVREFVRQLHAQGVNVQLHDVPLWGPTKLPPEFSDPWFESLHKPVSAQIALHFCMPHQVAIQPQLRNVNFTMFEAEPAPSSWIKRNLGHDLVIVPTESSRQAWLAGGMLEEKLRICPLGVDPTVFSGAAEALLLRLENGRDAAQYRTRFLNVSEVIPRKNLEGLLRAWIRATGPDDDAVLLLKLGLWIPGSREFLRAQCQQVETDLGKKLEHAAPIHFIHEIYPDEAMPRLYASATHYLSLSFGEGWDQAVTEAATSGLKLIVPNHSAYTSYLDSAVATLISSRMVPAKLVGDQGARSWFQDKNWWQPDEDEACAAIRAAIEGRDGDKPLLRQRMVDSFSWSAATKRLIEILGELPPADTNRRSFSSPRPRISPEKALPFLDSATRPAPRRAMPSPLVSVILTTRDRPRFLSLALRFYQDQTYSARELIVVDDGERFPVEAAAVESVGGRLIRMPGATPLGTKLNAGIEVARGRWCQKMDDDDWYSPQFMEKMMSAVADTQDVVCCPVIAFITPFLFFEIARWEVRQSEQNHMPGATLLFTRASWEERPFRPLFSDEDVWLLMDHLRCGAKLVMVPETKTFMAVRHRGLTSDRGHAWTHQFDGRTLEQSLNDRPLYHRKPEHFLPDFALEVYRALHSEMLSITFAAPRGA